MEELFCEHESAGINGYVLSSILVEVQEIPLGQEAKM